MSDPEFLMRIGEARYRLEKFYYDLPDLENETEEKLNMIGKKLIDQKNELFRILMLMNPNKEK